MATRKERLSCTPKKRRGYAKLMVEENNNNKRIVKISGEKSSLISLQKTLTITLMRWFRPVQ